MPASRNKRKRSEIDQGRVPTASARRGSSKTSSGNELKKAKNEAKNETEPSAISDRSAPAQVAELPFNSTISQGDAEKIEKSLKDNSLVGSEASENVPPPGQLSSCAIVNTHINENNSQQRQSPKFQPSVGENSKTSEGSRDESVANKDSRKSRIASSIAHRKLLLKRIRQCGAAANGRLSSLVQSEKEKNDIGSRAAVTKFAEGSETSLPVTDEVEYFRELSKVASQAAKRQRLEGEGAGENRPSVSLRRGASVGKRMNAALSSLAPGGNTGLAMLDPSPSTNNADPSANPQAPVAPPPDVPKPVVSQTPQSTVQPQGLTIRPLQQQQQPQQQQQHLVIQPAAVAVGKTIQTQPKEKAKRSGGQKQPKLNQSTTMSEQFAPAALPLHQRAGGSTLPPNRLAQPKVVCPEAKALRDKRGALRLKLAALLAAKSKPVKETSQSRPTSQHKQFQHFSSLETQKTSQEEQFNWETSEMDLSSCMCVPRRRKSHWDYLLEEMRWMATDYVEERKWKQSTARLLAFAAFSGSESSSLTQTTPCEQALVEVVENPVQVISAGDGEGGLHSNTDGKRQSDCSSSLITEHGNKYSRFRRYERPTISESKGPQRIARIIAGMPRLLSLAVAEAGAFPSSDSTFIEALRSWQQLCPKEASDEGTGDSSLSEHRTKIRENGININSSSHTSSESDATIAESGGNDSHVSREDSLQNPRGHLATYIDEMCSRAKAFTIQFHEQSKQVRLHEFFALSPEQEESIRFAEYIWSELDSAGFVIAGPAFCGKTAVTCSLLWKHRDVGPQLLMCSSASVVKWEFELGRFSGLKVVRLGLNGGISQSFAALNAQPKYKPGDVLVCEHSFLVNMPDLSSFAAIAIDCRNPGGFGCSISSKDWQHEGNCLTSEELVSLSWWEALLDKLPHRSVHRIIIDGNTAEMLQTKLTPFPRTTITDLEILALRTAFVLGPKAYVGANLSRARNIISWAKHIAREVPELGKTKAERVTAIILRTFSSFSYYFKHSPMSEANAFSCWELRKCTMPNSQRLAYNLACKEVRGILSLGLGEKTATYDGSDHMEEIVNSLLRLRRVCSHANLDRILSDSAVYGPLSGRLSGNYMVSEDEYWSSSTFWRRIRDSASQPDLERAFRILIGSGKIRELASILKNDCGCQIAGEEVLSTFFFRGEQQQDTVLLAKRRIVILAELPEVQLIISLFLSSVGLQHDFLLRIGGDPTVRRDNAQRLTLAWIEDQLSLFKFNSYGKELTATPSCAIVVGSPSSLGADHCGLGVACADMVILVDEDWSGRCEIVMRSIVTQVLGWNNGRHHSKTCSFIRLVSSGTCEEVFLSASNDSESKNCRLFCTTDSFGIVTDIRTTRPGDLGDGMVRRFWNFRGRDLSSVLGVQGELPLVFGSQARRKFLPRGLNDSPSDELDLENERRLIQHLLQKERRLAGSCISLSSNVRFSIRENQSQNTGAFFLVLPPLPSSFPKHAITRDDRDMFASRLYLEHFAKLSTSVAVEITSDPAKPADMAMWYGTGVESARVSDGSELIDSMQKGSLSCKPADIATSLLVYDKVVNVSVHSLRPQNATPARLKVSSNEQKRNEKVNSSVLTTVYPHQSEPERRNAFAGTYSLANTDTAFPDGNQGCEAAVYFPPLFPSLFAFSAEEIFVAQRPLTTQGAEGKTIMAGQTQREDNKRKQHEPNSGVGAPNSKRLKAQTVVSEAWAPGGGSIFFSPSEHLSALTAPPSPQPLYRNQTPHNAAALPAVIGSKEEVNVLEISTSQNATSDNVELERLRDLNEDFGLVGMGALPSLQLSTDAAGLVFVDCSATALDTESFGGEYEVNLYNIPCDSEEAESVSRTASNSVLLNSVVLFVVKPKQRSQLSTVGQQFRTSQNVVGDLQWTAINSNLPPLTFGGGNNGAIGDINGARKLKKKVPGPLPPLGPSAFSRLPVPDISEKGRPMAMPSSGITNKDGYRSRLTLPSQVSQTLGKAGSLFEVPSFRLASVRVRNRICLRAFRLDRSSSDRGHGLPMLELSSNQMSFSTSPDTSNWISFARKLKTPKSQTGDDARSLSAQQKAGLKRSLVAPCRVDFGPFQSGYLASPAGMTGISPPRSRIGVSLPMGVKVPQAMRENNVPPWSTAEEKKLQVCAVRFGLNWVLAARSLTGLEDILVSSRRSNYSDDNVECASFPRSARHCRERWQTLVRSQSSLAKDVRKSERVMRERAAMAANEIPRFPGPFQRLQAREEGKSNLINNASILLPATALELQDGSSSPMDMDVETNDGKPTTQFSKKVQPRRSFSACRAGRSKTVEIPLAMPGLASGGSSALVASHQSHMQAVQAALATSNPTSGRSELWPLQILEVADKNRAAAARAAGDTTSLSTAAGRPSSSHSHRSATSTSHGTGGASGRGVAFPQVPLSQPQRTSSAKGSSSSSSSQQERVSNTAAESPSRSPRKTIAPLPSQALPPQLQPPPLPPPPQQHPPRQPPSNPPLAQNPAPATTARGEDLPPNPG